MRTIIIVLLAVFTFSACHNIGNAIKGKGERITRTYEPGSFDEIHLSGTFDVILEQSDQERIVIETEENLFEHFDIDLRNDKLYVETDHMIFSEEGINVVIFYNSIEEIELDGACALESDHILKSDMLKVDMSGAGAMNLEIDVRELELDISGAGAVKLKGYAREVFVDMSGAGGLSAFNLITERFSVDISGVGSADIYVEEELSARIGGLGGINYKGNPKIKRSDVSGLGKIEKAD